MADYDLRGLDIDQLFALNPIPDVCIDAANRASRAFDSHFPGWELYARLVRGDTYYERRLRAWAITGARMLSRATRGHGKPYIRTGNRGPWIAVAAMDALAYVLGETVPSARERGVHLGISDHTYARIFNPVRSMMLAGLLEYKAELSYQLARVRRENRDEMRTPESRGIVGYHDAPRLLASGCTRTIPLQDQADAYADQRETLYPGLRPWAAWDESAAIATIHPGTASTPPDAASAQPETARTQQGHE